MKTIRVLVLFVMGVSAFSGFAQEGASSLGVGAGAPAGSAVVLNRRAAPTKQEVVPTDKYPFAVLQKALEQGHGADISSEIGSAAANVGLGVKVPPGWEPSKDVALSETAREAVALSAKLTNEQNNPVPGPDGRVVYTFGVGQPTLVPIEYVRDIPSGPIDRPYPGCGDLTNKILRRLLSSEPFLHQF